MSILGKIQKLHMINDIKKSITLSFFELKIRNHNTYLGFFWYLLQPLFMFSILFYVKSNILKSDINNFLPYLLIGVIMIHFFISSTNLMMTAITGNYELLNSRKINPKIFIWSRFFVSLWINLFESLLAIILLAFFGYYYGVFYLLVLPLYMLFTFGVGSILCVISTKFFDAVYVWNYFCQILWFITPIYFVIESSDFLTKYNPLGYFINLARNCVYGMNQNSLNLIGVCVFMALISYFLSELVFKYQGKFLTERNK